MDEHTFETVAMLMARPLEYGDTFGTCRPSFSEKCHPRCSVDGVTFPLACFLPICCTLLVVLCPTLLFPSSITYVIKLPHTQY